MAYQLEGHGIETKNLKPENNIKVSDWSFKNSKSIKKEIKFGHSLSSGNL